MNKVVKIDEMPKILTQILSSYSDEITREIKKDVDDVADEGLKLLKSKAPVKKGKYKKALRKDTAFESLVEKRNVLFARGAQAHLTHLLEDGHVFRNGGRAKAYPHFKYADEYVQKELPKKIKNTIKEKNNE